MKKIYQNLFIFLITIVSITSCSNDDQGAIALNGGEVFRSQVVTINLPNTNLSLKEYEATLDGRAITLSRSEDHKLLFLMPEDADLGTHTLTIPKLNEATVTYDIKETVLEETPVKTLDPLFENIKIYNQTLTNATTPEAFNMQKNITFFTNYYNNASDEEKTQLALAYKANKTQFDQIILNDYSNVEGRSNFKGETKLYKFLFAVAAVGTGSQLAVNGGVLEARALGVIVSLIGFNKAIDYYNQFVEIELKQIGLMIDSEEGINERSSLANGLSLQSDVMATYPISTLRRKLNSSDTKATQPLLISFFKSTDNYNYIVGKVNAAILYLNANNSFFQIDTFELATLPTSTSANLSIADQEIFNKMTFSVSHPNLKLISSSLESDGQLNLKIKIIGTPKTLPVESFLNYQYSDNFSKFSGKIPLVVKQNNPFIGTWKLLSYNGHNTGEYTNTYYECSYPAEAVVVNSDILVFTDNTVDNHFDKTYKRFNIEFDKDCNLISDEADSYETVQYQYNATYTIYNANTLLYKSSSNGQLSGVNYNFINKDKLLINDLFVYIRQ